MGDHEHGAEGTSRREFLRRAGMAAAALGLGAAAKLPAWGAAAAKAKMQYRPFGKTGHMSSLLCFGGVMLDGESPETADWAVRYAVEHGVNHFDVAPSYGNAELRLGPALKRYRDKVFLSCKTQKRTAKEAEAEFHESLKRLQTDHFDLYQFHWLDQSEDLNTVTGPGGAWEFFQKIRQQGLVKFLGITGHRPKTQLEALRRMPLDTVMFPVSFVEWKNTYVSGHEVTPLLEYAKQHHLGVVALKATSGGLWPGKERPYRPFYQPLSDADHITKGMRFTLSHPVTTAAGPGDTRLLKDHITAAAAFTPMSAKEQADLVATAGQYLPIFPYS
jgi:predicted aldo/keto reductase-like oxidoreductase